MQLADGLGLDLADTLTGDTEVAAHLLQRAGAAIVQTKAQADDLFLTGSQALEGLIDLLGHHGAVRCLAGGLGVLVGHEIAQGGIFFLAHGAFQAGGFLRHALDLTHALHAHIHGLCQLLRGGLVAVLVDQLIGGLTHPVDGLDHVHRDADGASLIRNGAGDGLTDPPGGVGGEAEATVAVKLLGGLDQADVALLDQVQERQVVADMLLGDGDHQTQVGLAQAAAGVQAVAADLEQLLAALLRQGAVFNSLHGLLFGSLFLVVLAGLGVAVLVQILGIAPAVLILLEREAGAVLFDVLRRAVLLAVGLKDVGSLGTGVDALAQVHFLLRAQQRDLADLLEVVLHRVIQQLIHGSLQVCGVFLCRVVLIFIAQAQLIAVCLGTFHLCHDAFHIQAGVTVGLVIQNFDAALLQKRVKRFHIHPALGSQCLGLARRQGAFALRQQFLQSHAHFALSFSPRRWLRRK